MEELHESIISEPMKSKGIKELAKNVDNPDDAAELTKEMDSMIKSKKNNILLIAYHQGEIWVYMNFSCLCACCF